MFNFFKHDFDSIRMIDRSKIFQTYFIVQGGKAREFLDPDFPLGDVESFI